LAPDGPFAPSPDDLATAYRAGGSELAGHASAYAVVTDADGVLVLGTTSLVGGAERTWLARLGPDGAVRWRRDDVTEEGAGRALARTDSGWVVAGEVACGEARFRAWLVRLDESGDLVRSQRLGGAGDTGFSALAVITGGVVVAGGAQAGRAWLRSDGRDLELDGLLDIVALAPVSDGGLVAAAVRERSTTSLGMSALVGLSSKLDERWRCELDGQLAAVAALDDDGAVAAGTADSGLRCIRFDRGGTVVWERTIGPGYGRGLALVADGLVAVGDAPGAEGRRMVAAQLSDAGEVAWERACGLENERLQDAVAVKDGVVVVGSLGRERRTAFARALSRDGDRRWERAL
jgi:hypothetical protein